MMEMVSTRDSSLRATVREAVLQGLAPDGGLYVPTKLPILTPEICDSLSTMTLQEISIAVANLFLSNEVPKEDITEIVTKAINFPDPLISLNDHLFSLELFHGPSMAFKDFGARFMAELMSWFIRGEDDPLHILVATSGDTGGAVALGFLGVPGIEVSILYPSGRVSELQELQLTTNGQNISAYEVDGSFDDCQAMVKASFLDQDIKQSMRLSSANSINIARLIPQSFYYLHALSQFQQQDPTNRDRELAFSIPSGNFGNLCAGLYAKTMSQGHFHLLAATNVNDSVPRYLLSGAYEPKESIATISNAMDVGAPSNFERLQHLLRNDISAFRENISGYRFTDEETRNGLTECFQSHSYQADPHGAIGYLAAQAWLAESPDNRSTIFLETAHPIKFSKEVKSATNHEIVIPEQVKMFSDRTKQAQRIPPDPAALKEHLLA